MITFSPDAAEPLISVLSSEYPVSASVTASAEAGEEGGAAPSVTVTYEADPEMPAQIEITASGDTVSVSVPDWNGVFPPEGIDYLLGDQLNTADDWDDLPEAAREVIEFRPHSTPIYQFWLTVHATSSEGDSESETYTIEVICDYTPGRDTLQEAVDARR